MRKILTPILLLAITVAGYSQKVVQSTSQVISSKAAKGSLYDYSNEGDKIKLTYLLKESKNGLETETYEFEKSSLKFISSKEELVQANKFTGKSGEKMGDKLLRIYPNISTGKPKIQEGHMLYYTHPRYVVGHFIVERELDPKSGAGEKIYYIHHRTEEADNNQIKLTDGHDHKMNIGDVQLLGLIKSDGKIHTRFSSMIINAKDLSYTNVNEFELDYSYTPLAGHNLPNGDIAVVFRSYTMKDFPKPDFNKKNIAAYKLAEDYHLRYLQINTKGEIVQNVKIDMKQPEERYDIYVDISSSNDGKEIMVIGSTREMKVVAPAMTRQAYPRTVWPKRKSVIGNKVERLFVAKISNNKLEFSKNYPIDDLLKNLQVSEGADAPKDVQDYCGKWAQRSIQSTQLYNKNGKTIALFVKADGSNNHAIQFSETGEIEANYLIGFPKKMRAHIDMECYENSAGELNLFAYFMPEVKKDAPESEWKEAAKSRGCLVYSLDPKSKSLSKPVNITPNATLDLHDPFFFEGKDSFVTLGNGRKKEIVLSRISLK
jgi:hypothetical protein